MVFYPWWFGSKTSYIVREIKLNPSIELKILGEKFYKYNEKIRNGSV